MISGYTLAEQWISLLMMTSEPQATPWGCQSTLSPQAKTGPASGKPGAMRLALGVTLLATQVPLA